MKYHYVYKVILPETNEFYIGSRSCICKPSLDNYKGSMKTWKVDKTKLIKEIIKEFDNRDLAMMYEAELLNIYINDKLNRNYQIPPYTFHTTGKDCGGNKNGFFNKKHTDESKKKTSEKVSGVNNPSYGKKWINNGKNILYVKKEKLEYYLQNGWKLGNLRITFDATNRKWINNGKINKLIKKEDIDKYSNWNFGRILKPESIEIIKKANKDKKISDETRKKLSNSKKGKKKSEEWKKKIGENSKNRIWMNNGIINKMIKKNETQSFYENGWVSGQRNKIIFFQ